VVNNHDASSHDSTGTGPEYRTVATTR